ncbi:biopolymer transporter ExbD [Alteromonas sp. ASW11-36]|uniref:Biopolymer transporter ExbD n=1 Tax=Alteromonas arenosi TaxID=3055817 RepID=A0ABT7SUG2_9ALTE|nr:biopolymer transporter ExbD [Alteromonas sp. ASW11-36]MDM7859826.1 biopolymer transporter ExbD [Alteromonas sp. ASW11-36]
MRRFISAQAQDQEASVDITPMLDVVFIMLIFFIVTATFVKLSGIEVDAPQASTSVVQEKANILIAIDANNKVWINRREVDVRALRPNIERLHAENPKGIVVIQADRMSRNEVLVQVMDASRKAGVYDIALAADRN